MTLKPGDTRPRGKTDWARLDAMTDEEVLAAARSDPDAQPLTPERLARMRRVSRVKVLRHRLGMTQAEFAQAFHLPITTLRDWEQRRSVPDAPARALLLAIERDPKVMRRLLSDRAA
jgi:putative transcriptional regulator